jgi:hypothetical protein
VSETTPTGATRTGRIDPVAADTEDEFPEISDLLPEVYVCLGMSGTFDPQVICDLLGVEAKIYRAGDPLPRGPRELDGLHYSTPRERTYDLPAHVEQILGVIRPHADRFNELRTDLNLDVSIHIVVWMDERSPIGSLSASTVAEIASIGAAIDIDLYHDEPDVTPGA